MELLQKDNLLIHLRSLRNSEVATSLLLGYCRQTACGMHYLSGLGFIHRDLAARNILLNPAGICKVSRNSYGICARGLGERTRLEIVVF